MPHGGDKRRRFVWATGLIQRFTLSAETPFERSPRYPGYIRCLMGFLKQQRRCLTVQAK